MIAFIEVYRLLFSWMPTPLPQLVFCFLAVHSFVLVMNIWKFIKDRIPFF